MKVENLGLIKLKDVHTGECFEKAGYIGIKTDEKNEEDGETCCKVVWLGSGVLGTMDENDLVIAVDAKVVRV